MAKELSFEQKPLLFLTALLAIAGLYLYELMPFLMPIITLLVLQTEGGIKKLKLSITPPFIFMFLLLSWGAVSVLWAQNTGAVVGTIVSLSITFFFALILISSALKASPNLINKTYTILELSFVSIIVLIAFQIILEKNQIYTFHMFKNDHLAHTPYIMKPSGSVLGAMIFVSSGFLWMYKRKILSICIFLLGVGGILLTQCQTATYGLILASLIFCASYWSPFWITRISLISSYTFLILTPLIYLYVLPLSFLERFQWVRMNTSLYHRCLGWDYLVKKFVEHPIIGWGLKSTSRLPTTQELAPGYPHLPHAHNSGLQAYLELGLPGGILFALFFASLFWVVEKNVKERLSVAVCNATLVFIFVQAEINNNLWRNYWLSWVTLIGAFVVIFLRAREAQLRVEADHS